MSRKAKVIILLLIIVLIGGGFFWVWNKWTGKYKIGADAIIGCQKPKDITSLVGTQGANLTSYNLFGHQVSVNKMLAPFLDNVQADVHKANTGYAFDIIQTYNDRPKISGGGDSLHSWAIAIDINPGRNPYQLGKTGDPQTDLPGPVVDAFKRYGFAWGGDWVGERDPMHFEWYGAEVFGNIIDAQNGQKVVNDLSVTINGAGAPVSNGEFFWVLETTHPHEVVVKARGYEDHKFTTNLTCFEKRNMDIALKPLPENLPGSISGKVTLSGGKPPLIPATIAIDGKTIGATNVKGDYVIAGVRRGKHKVEAKILFFPGSSIETPDLIPGENVRNLNFTIGK